MPRESPVLLNVLLCAVLAFAIYLGLMYVETQQNLQQEEAARTAAKEALPATELPPVPQEKSILEPPPPSSPLYIKDDLTKLVNTHDAIKEAFKGYASVGLILQSDGAGDRKGSNESFTIHLAADGSVKDVSKGISSGVEFSVKATPESFRRVILLAKHENLLGVVERFSEMEFSPSSARKEFINKLHQTQGFTSKVRS